MGTSSKLVAVFVVGAWIAVEGCAGDSHAEATRSKRAAARPQRAQEIKLSVTSAGFVPAKVTVTAGKPVTLVVTREATRTCATHIVIKDFGIHKPLPLNQAVRVTFTPARPGRIRYACAMDMIAGVIVVE
ncbi:MAG: cupredoxin domain-containing protein [Deltaproteobacteria bacterium]|nr:cupredoxin domain-containing protein [Deltaproteobacteria bacterium]